MLEIKGVLLEERLQVGALVGPGNGFLEQGDRDVEGRERGKKLRERGRMTNYLSFELTRYDVQLSMLQDQSSFISAAVDDVLGAAKLDRLDSPSILARFS